MIPSMLLLLPSIRSLFNLLLSVAGFFLAAKFLLDELSMMHFMAKTRQYLIHGHHYFFLYYHLAQFIAALVVAVLLLDIGHVGWLRGSVPISGHSFISWRNPIFHE